MIQCGHIALANAYDGPTLAVVIQVKPCDSHTARC